MALYSKIRVLQISAVFFSFVFSNAIATTIHVPHDYTSLVSALAAATSGDTVVVACGQIINEDLDMKSGVVLRSETATADCAELTQGIMFNGTDPGTELNGFTLPGIVLYNANDILVRNCTMVGGGVYPFDESMVFRFENCKFQNSNFRMDLDGATAVFEGCSFSQNLDGAIYSHDYGSLELYDCSFSENGRLGGAVKVMANVSLTVDSCDFINNVADQFGGAIMLDTYALQYDVPANISNSYFQGNQTEGKGGAISTNSGSETNIQGCVFEENEAGQRGGAIYSQNAGPVTLSDCLFVGNEGGAGGAVFSESRSDSPSMKIEGCTFARNRTSGSYGPAIFAYKQGSAGDIPNFIAENCIIAFHDGPPPVHCNDCFIDVSCTDIFGNAGGDWSDCLEVFMGINDNISVDPLFCGDEYGYYALSSASPCTPENNPACGLIGALPQGCQDPAGADQTPRIGEAVQLLQNYPNPFNPNTAVSFDLSERESVSLRVFDLSGRLIRTLITAEPHTPGRHEVVWNGRDKTGRQVASGTYFYRLEAGSFSETRRMVLIK